MDKNPKDITGAQKLPLHSIPTTALAHLGIAIAHGNNKHGGWRGKEVKASVYINAILRHVYAYAEGEDNDRESYVHHLAAVMGSCAILLDARELGNLTDDRDAQAVGMKDIYERWKNVHKGRSVAVVKAARTKV